MPHPRALWDEPAEPLVRVGVAAEEAEAFLWVEELTRAGIEAAVEIADGATVAPGRTSWTGQFFVYPVLVPAGDRERAERIVGQLIAADEEQRRANAVLPIAATVALVLALVIFLVARGSSP